VKLPPLNSLPGAETLTRIFASPLPASNAPRLNYRRLVEAVDEAWQQIERDPFPAERLSLRESCARCLHDAWLECLAPTLNQRYGAFLETQREGEEETHRQAFMQALWNHGLGETLNEFPVLPRLLLLRRHHWRDSLQEFFSRWEQDQSEVMKRFFPGRNPGALQAIHMGLSDAHGGGRSVAILSFTAGERLVYKPKPLQLEALLPGIAKTLEGAGYPFPVVCLPTWNRGEYGWTSYLADDTAAKSQPRAELARQLGQMTALAHAIGCTDLHPENFAVAAGRPVLWDLETLFRPHFKVGQRGESQHPSRRAVLSRYEDSLMGVGVLDDQMPLKSQTMRMSDSAWQGFRDGFHETYEWQLRHQSVFREVWDSLPLDLSVRTVFQPTAHYARILQGSFNPAFLRSDADWVACLSQVRSNFGSETAFEQWLHEAEVGALSRLDVPAFRLRGNRLQETGGWERDLAASEDEFIGALDHARACLARLSEDDLAFQLRLIDFHRADSEDPPDFPSVRWPETLDSSPTAPLERSGLVLIDQIIAEGEYHETGAQWWSRTISRQGKARLAPILAPLYDGAAGLALSFGAAWRVTGEDQYREATRAALRPLLHEFTDSNRSPRMRGFYGVGGISGMASLVYTCRHLARWDVGEEAQTLLDSLMDLITPEEISKDRELDVISGAAGLILCLLPADDTPVPPAVIDKARWAGEHLMAKQPAPPTPWQPAQADKKPWGGFSHGAAGFALALHRLNQVTGESGFAEESNRWVDYQEGLRHAVTGHYRDLRSPEGAVRDWQGSAMTSWCNGTPGIGLAWSEIDPQLGAACLRPTVDYPMEQGRDFLCCGNFGRIACAFSSAKRLQDDVTANLMQDRAAALLPSGADREFSWRLGKNRDNLGFFTGTSGIAYTLLRLIHPDRLPCVAGLE